MSFYTYTDKALKYLRRFYVREYNRTKMMIRLDELNVVNLTRALYSRMESETEKVFLRIARQKHREITGEDTLTMAWLLDFLGQSDPLTGYIFLNEVERKRQYYTESLMSGDGIDKETKKALRYWYGMIRQYADLTAIEAARLAYESQGMPKVQWITNMDGKECWICHDRNLKVYPINAVPNKPHYGCRCYIRGLR